MKAANGINEEQISESDCHQEYEGHRIFADVSHLKEEDNEDTDGKDESHDLSNAEKKKKKKLVVNVLKSLIT